MTKLTDKQQAFIANKLAGVTNRDAAIAAGYAVAGAAVAANKLMGNPAIRKAIKGVEAVAIKSSAPAMPCDHYDNAMAFLLDVMNLEQLPIAVRADAAKQLLPYQHARMGETGKKEKAKERAHALSGGTQFKSKQPPKLN